MRRLLAQEFELMRREVHHQQFAAGLEQTRGFGDRGGRIVEEVQHLVQDDGVGGAVGKRDVVKIAVAGLRMCEPGALELHARIASMSRLRSKPRARVARGANSSSMRPVPVPRSTRSVKGPPPSASSTAASTWLSATCSARILSHSPACSRK